MNEPSNINSSSQVLYLKINEKIKSAPGGGNDLPSSNYK